ncbi:hypothetical protein [Paeniglutamicibacter kerguelensis]|uniref:TfoX/Sxy family protein n=1 Tax=Paeniglutamicibacter kerguelensis TaxID=254788 RepID=A0ABS4XJU4_9MICC|nr:hypothetical protein [Paeniglutamicibacter kerguelensis]MBP2388738.1 hypothetical protein [Paeniglutamicibacter kerguelensis]
MSRSLDETTKGGFDGVMSMQFPTPEAMAEYQRISRTLLGEGVKPGKMFGKDALKFESKAIACLLEDRMAFKVGRDSKAMSQGMECPGAALFDPSGQGRPFRDWVAVPESSMERWEQLAQAALSAALEPETDS